MLSAFVGMTPLASIAVIPAKAGIHGASTEDGCAFPGPRLSISLMSRPFEAPPPNP